MGEGRVASLDRFRLAQEDPQAGLDTALAELRTGHKATHWIWYVFPQLRGLGNSPAAQIYGIAGVSEAAAYLRDPVLRGRLLSAASTALEQVRSGVSLDTLMGARIDVLKLVSSMTLFGAVARHLAASDRSVELTQVADTADAILRAAAAEGVPPCAFTQHAVGRG